MRALVLVAAVSLLAAPAAATTNFPAAIGAHLGAPSPPCTICHQGQPGRGTVTTAFGQAMLARGLVAYDEASLTTALDALAAEGHDSNGNGVTDIDELTAGNDPSAGAGNAVVPEYGCIGSVAGVRRGGRAGRAGGSAALAALGLLLGLRVRRRPR